MALLYSNENFPRKVVECLRQLGHDVLTSYDAGNANQKIPDDEVLQYAISLGRAVLTLNRRDFVQLHKSHRSHAGIIICTLDHDVSAFAVRIDLALSKEPNLAGKLIRVVKPATSSGAGNKARP